MGLQFGRYETIQPLASGGMAAVYLGRAVGAGGFERRVAIKVMHQHIADDPDFVAMFLDEARLAARIHHPNVVGTIDVQKSDEGMFLVMDYIEGASLKGVLRGMRKRRQRIPYGITVRIICDTLAGLHAAHELKAKGGAPMNLVHRDVSPHNILVGTDGVARITDFGVARAEARLSTTRGGQLKGKIAYMPPEQGLGNDVDRRADIYAAGVCLWEMLVGRRLFKAEHDGQLVALVLQGAEQAPIDVVKDLPAPLNDVCMRALALRPDDRYQSAAQFAEELETALHDAGIRMATTRQVAAFAEDFKVEVRASTPPIASDDSVTGIESFPSQPISLATMPELAESSQTSVGGQAASVAGLVTMGGGFSRKRRARWAMAGAAAAAAVAVAIAVVAFSGGEPATEPAPAAQVPPPVTANAEPAASEALPEPSTPKPPASTEPKVAEKTDAEKVAGVEKKPATEKGTIPGVTPRRPAGKPTVKPKGPPKSPLDFDTDTL